MAFLRDNHEVGSTTCPRVPGCYAVAHRGLSSEVTENTLAAFQAAAAAGFASIELDARITRDGEVVVLHDAGIERTTRGNGKVADMRYDELRTYSTPHGPIPRLDDVMAAMHNWPGIWNLEVKAPKATEPLVHLVEHHEVEQRALVSSFDPAVLAIARDAHPGIARALIVMGPPDEADVATAVDLECTWLNLDFEFLTAASITGFKSHGLRVGAWTVNDAITAKTLRAYGADCIITDVTEVLHALADSLPRV